MRLKNKVILAALGGITDGKFCRKVAELGAGAVTLGGIDFDRETMEASMLMVKRGRKEFVIELNKLEEYIKNEVKIIEGLAPVIINARFATEEGLLRAIEISNKYGDIIELNLHCRQPEIILRGGGQYFAFYPALLLDWLEQHLDKVNIPLIIKFRANVTNELRLVKLFKEIGVKIFHIDAMHPYLNLPDINVIERIRNQNKDITIIGGNSIRDIDTANLFLRRGSDYISIGRLAIEDINKLKTIIEHFNVERT